MEFIGSVNEGALGENKVFSEDDDVELARPSSEVDILDNDDVGQPSAKSQRRVIMPSASEDVIPRSRLRTRRPTATQLRLAETHARRQVKSRHIMQETVEFDMGEGPLACEPKSTKMSLSDLLSE
ncbi:hypothetical protein AXG93_1923s1100 [Marchantia polymorpha subsp. ruderalis]|uniref:Uncharacterized protein n=1 Tax=Marchantia polymorpha subsp. ruderalis TaxID=1480154 RepID=A0A176VCG3_MARPO|nr:hypothetical protein AXG93_1923s1100 [Marchantia polymorpha subsp. ruderalis]